MDMEQDYQSRKELRRNAQETRQHSRQICEEASDAQERARETMSLCLLARQLRTEAREVIHC